MLRINMGAVLCSITALLAVLLATSPAAAWSDRPVETPEGFKPKYNHNTDQANSYDDKTPIYLRAYDRLRENFSEFDVDGWSLIYKTNGNRLILDDVTDPLQPGGMLTIKIPIGGAPGGKEKTRFDLRLGSPN